MRLKMLVRTYNPSRGNTLTYPCIVTKSVFSLNINTYCISTTKISILLKYTIQFKEIYNKSKKIVFFLNNNNIPTCKYVGSGKRIIYLLL